MAFSYVEDDGLFQRHITCGLHHDGGHRVLRGHLEGLYPCASQNDSLHEIAEEQPEYKEISNRPTRKVVCD